MLFLEWLASRNLSVLLQLLETADFFAPQQYQIAFEEARKALLTRLSDPDARQQVEGLRNLDWCGYIVNSLKRAGFRGDDLQETFHAIVVRLLLKPGKLFQWSPLRHGPLEKRFRRSVWNAIRNSASKARTFRRRTTNTDPGVMADRFAGRQDHSSPIIDQFRQIVAQRLGTLAAAILDWRLEGHEIKDMIGNPEFNSPSAYQIKREVQEIKRLAHEFAVKHDDPGFLNAVSQRAAGEAKTVQKRQQAMVARQAGRQHPS